MKHFFHIFFILNIFLLVGFGCKEHTVIEASTSTPSIILEQSTTSSFDIDSTDELTESINNTYIDTLKQDTSAHELFQNSEMDIYYEVIKVIDGDTIDVQIDGTVQRLRLIGLNTPETVDPRKPVECFGKEASDKAKELLFGKRVRLELDTTQQNSDIYGRLLRYVFLEDGLFYNKYMIEHGFAYEYTYRVPYYYQKEFKDAQRIAQEKGIGLWGPLCNIVSLSDTPSVSMQEQGSHATGATIPSTIDALGYYTSSHHSATFYYCSNHPQWEQLSKKYLKFYETEEALLADYPNKTLHTPCR